MKNKIITNKTLIAGQPGTKKWVEKYGDKLVCIRYKYNKQYEKKFITVELIDSEKKWEKNTKRIPRNKIVSIKINRDEYDLQKMVKSLGGKWISKNRYWKLQYSAVLALGLESRIINNI